MHLQVIARSQLAGCVPRAGLRLLAEGDWPAAGASSSDTCRSGRVPRRMGTSGVDGGRLLSLNELGDARFAWIDDEADALCGRLVDVARLSGPSYQGVPLVPLFALGLRYYLVKLLRFGALVEKVIQKHGVRRAELVCEPQRDGDYVALFDAVGRRCDVERRVQFRLVSEASSAGSPPACQPERGIVSRVVARLTAIPVPRATASPYIFLCGDPGVFGRLPERLSATGGWGVGWLWERCPAKARVQTAVRKFWTSLSELVGPGSTSGVRCSVPLMLECRGGGDAFYGYLARRFAAELSVPSGSLSFQGTPLGPLVARWLCQQLSRAAPLLETIDGLEAHFAEHGPRWLLVDEDATPLKRAAIAVARRHGAQTAVVQHGVPYIPFGFAPLEADRLFAWGETSAEQLARWKVPAERIVITGAPKLERGVARPARQHRTGTRCDDPAAAGHEAVAAPSALRAASGELLLVATPHHAEDRPDLLRFHLTARTNAELIRTAIGSLEALAGWRLVIKLHPRERDPGFFHRLVSDAGALRRRVKIVRRAQLRRLVERASVVLSCASTAGVEALAYGRPVIQLMPRGSGDLIDAARWGFAGTARSIDELHEVLAGIRAANQKPDTDAVTRNFANVGTAGAECIADFLERPVHECHQGGAAGARFEQPRRGRSQRQLCSN